MEWVEVRIGGEEVEAVEKTVAWGGWNTLRGALKAKHRVRVHPLHSLQY